MAALEHDPDIAAEQISVCAREGDVTLIGDIGTRDLRHRAEEIAACIPGVLHVHSELRVKRSEERERYLPISRSPLSVLHMGSAVFVSEAQLRSAERAAMEGRPGLARSRSAQRNVRMARSAGMHASGLSALRETH